MLDRRVAADAGAAPAASASCSLLQHLIASHHGKLEFGAAVPPMTLEAEVLHFADNASAKTASMAEALADRGKLRRPTRRQRAGLWQLDRRRAYRGDERLGSSRGLEDKKERPPSRG